jgi:hypothetical protein
MLCKNSLYHYLAEVASAWIRRQTPDARRQTPDASRLLVTVEPYFYLKTAQTFVDAGLDQDSPQPIAELMRSF